MNQKMFIYLPIACVFGLIYRFLNVPEARPKKPVLTIQPESVLTRTDSLLDIAEKCYQETNYTEAFALYQLYTNDIAFNGLHMRHLGMLYQWGRGCAVDTAKAIHWYKQAVEHGDAVAKNYLKALNYTKVKFAHLIVEVDSTTTVLDLSGDTVLNGFLSIFKYKQLKTISLRNCKLKKLPPEIGQLTQLEELYLDGNLLTTLPVEISHLTQLKTLRLMDNQLTSLPNVFNKLTKLEYLDVSNNKIPTFPTSLLSLKYLTWLVLDRNAIQQLPENIGLLKPLVHLSLNGNQLKILPKSFYQLTNLEILHLRNNQLTKFSTEAKQLSHLKYLYLSYNQLKQLPDVLCQMKFEELALSPNPYEVVPSCLR